MDENNLSETEQLIGEPQLVIDYQIRDYLFVTVKWGRFLGILGFVGVGLLALFGILIIIFGSTFYRQGTQPLPAGFGVFLGLIYCVLALFYYFPVKYLFDFSNLTKEALLQDSQQNLRTAFSNLKSLFKFMGISSLVVLGMYAIIIFVSISRSLVALT